MEIAEREESEARCTEFEISSAIAKRTLCSRRNHRPDEIEAVDRSRYAVERRDFAGQRVYAERLGAGSNEDGCATFLSRQGERR